MQDMRTPGVYVQEINAFPNSVVQAQTGIPLFVGNTEKAVNEAGEALEKPQRITSMMDYVRFFGGPPQETVTFDGEFKIVEPRFYLYRAVQLFFSNGGGTAYIQSIGSYENPGNQSAMKAVFDEGSEAERNREPDLVVIPDAMRFEDAAIAADIYNTAMNRSENMHDKRLIIIDVHNGKTPLSSNLQPVEGFRELITGVAKNGAIYYPWINTNLVASVGLEVCDDAVKTELKSAIDADFDTTGLPAEQAGPLKARAEGLKALIDEGTPAGHASAMSQSPGYASKMKRVLQVINVQPVAGAIAGTYARIDSTIGVFKAPANTGLTSVLSPTSEISEKQQRDLNMPGAGGRAVNAIRSFTGRGTLIWGARTVDGDSQDWRYVNVRRTVLMFERSIRSACESYVFAPNTAQTWVSIKALIENFLTNQWKAGALAGATPKEAFEVRVGLGSTMTSPDVLDGIMNVEIYVAVARPAEFIILKFQQKMQTS